jgi:hypothetical protein
MDPIFAFIEGSDLSMWIRGDSMLAFPTIITLHTIGMGFLAGGSAAIDLRILGAASGVPLKAMAQFRPVLWLAFIVNAITGVLMVIAYPTKQLTNPVFYTKLSLLVFALWLLYRVVTDVVMTEEADRKALTSKAKILASLSLAAWVGLIIAGRLLQYTHKWELLGVRSVI